MTLLLGGARPPAEEPFQWRDDLDRALAEAASSDRLVLLYFPPVLAADPRAIRRAGKIEKLSTMVVGVKVRGHDVSVLRKAFRVEKLPALLLLDPRGAKIDEVQGSVPSTIWKWIAREHSQYARQIAKGRERLKRAAVRLDAGEVPSAWAVIRPLLETESAAPSLLAEAKKLEAQIVAAARERMVAALGKEGLVDDRELISALEALRARGGAPAALRALERELERLRTTTPGGR